MPHLKQALGDIESIIKDLNNYMEFVIDRSDQFIKDQIPNDYHKAIFNSKILAIKDIVKKSNLDEALYMPGIRNFYKKINDFKSTNLVKDLCAEQCNSYLKSLIETEFNIH